MTPEAETTMVAVETSASTKQRVCRKVCQVVTRVLLSTGLGSVADRPPAVRSGSRCFASAVGEKFRAVGPELSGWGDVAV